MFWLLDPIVKVQNQSKKTSWLQLWTPPHFQHPNISLICWDAVLLRESLRERGYGNPPSSPPGGSESANKPWSRNREVWRWKPLNTGGNSIFGKGERQLGRQIQVFPGEYCVLANQRKPARRQNAVFPGEYCVLVNQLESGRGPIEVFPGEYCVLVNQLDSGRSPIAVFPGEYCVLVNQLDSGRRQISVLLGEYCVHNFEAALGDLGDHIPATGTTLGTLLPQRERP